MPFMPFFYLSSSLAITLACAIIPNINGSAYLGPALAMTQGLVPLRMRAQAPRNSSANSWRRLDCWW